MVRRRARPLGVYALLFRLAQALVLGPLLALGGRALSGRPVIDSTELVQFLLSPRGLVDVLLTSSVLLTLWLIEQAGLSAIALGDLHQSSVSVSDAFRFVGSKAIALLRLAGLLIVRFVLILLPFLAVAGFFASRLLGEHDINYYIARRPPEAIRAVVVIGLVGAATLVVLVRRVVGWRLSLHATAFEDASASAALKRSDVLVHRDWRHLFGYWATVSGAGMLIGAGAVWLAHHGGLALLGAIAHRPWLSVFVVALVAGLGAAIHATIGAAVAITDATVFATAFDELRSESAHPLTARLEQVAAARDLTIRGHGLRALILAMLALLVLGVVAVWRGGEALVARPPVGISAHRGSSLVAPENSRSAFERAITDGADWLETDVQETLDDSLVIVHDADLARLANVPRRVSEMTLAEIREVDIGTPFDSAFRGEKILTLDEVLELARGRVGVNIELKHYPGERKLAERVVEAVRRKDMLGEVVIQSLVYRGLEQVRQIEPRIPLGYLISLEVKDPWGLDVDFYSMNSRLITPKFVLRAHRQGRDVYAWTVDDSTLMVRLDGMGVDNFITNEPALARRVLARGEADPVARRVRRLRAWLGG